MWYRIGCGKQVAEIALRETLINQIIEHQFKGIFL